MLSYKIKLRWTLGEASALLVSQVLPFLAGPSPKYQGQRTSQGDDSAQQKEVDPHTPTASSVHRIVLESPPPPFVLLLLRPVVRIAVEMRYIVIPNFLRSAWPKASAVSSTWASFCRFYRWSPLRALCSPTPATVKAWWRSSKLSTSSAQPTRRSGAKRGGAWVRASVFIRFGVIYSTPIFSIIAFPLLRAAKDGIGFWYFDEAGWGFGVVGIVVGVVDFG